jgi:hypothetical protein
VLGVLGMIKVPAWLTYEPLSSYQLLVIGGALLVVAAILIGLRRKTRIALDSSLVTEELMLYLARIANALEQPTGPSAEQVTAEVLRRLEEVANTHDKPNGNVKEVPFSIFGREYRRE